MTMGLLLQLAMAAILGASAVAATTRALTRYERRHPITHE